MMPSRRWRRCLAVAVPLLMARPALLAAQARGVEFTVAGGGVFLTNALSTTANAGALLQLAVVQGPSAGRVRARLGGEVFHAPLRASRGEGNRTGRLLNVGVSYDALLGPVRRGTAPYAVLGLGASVFGENVGDGWPGFLATARTGVGVRRRLPHGEVYAEATLVSAVAGAGGFIRPRAVWWPVTIGITF